MQVIPSGVLQTLQTQPLKETSADASVSGVTAAIHAMHDLLLQYRQGLAQLACMLYIMFFVLTLRSTSCAFDTVLLAQASKAG